jgi:hypothetical protein
LASSQAVGAYGESDQFGAFGFARTAQGIGVHGNTAFGAGTGIWGNSTTGVAVLGTCNGSGKAGRFEGNVEVTGDISLVNGDMAEDFATSNTDLADPGTVMALDEEGRVRPSDRAYDKRVAGVVSGAGAYKPAIILGKAQTASRSAPIALVGKVYCKVDAQYGAIEVGDLLTTSRTPGHAMKAGDAVLAFGSVIGKALGALKAGQGLVPILIALQ